MAAINHPSDEIISNYALQALEPDEACSVKEHLSTCLACSQLLKEYEAITDGLLFALPPQVPSAQLRSRLAATIKSGKPVTTLPLSRSHFSFLKAALGAAVIVLLIATAYLVLQVSYLQQKQAVLLLLLDQNQASLALVLQPGIRIIPLNTNDMTGNVVINPNGQGGALFLRGLTALDAELTYQVWLIPSNGAPQSAGLFQVLKNQPFVSIPITNSNLIKNFANLGITIEPIGGSITPTTKLILLVNVNL